MLDPEPEARGLDDALGKLTRAMPGAKGARVTHRWAGVMDATPDAVPVIDAVASVPGLHLASGFSGHGFGIGPGAGALMADLVAGDAPRVDPAPFRLARFDRAGRRSTADAREAA